MKVIGLMSGTSVDGIDSAIVDITGEKLNLKIKLLASNTYPYPDSLRKQILEVCAGLSLSMEEFTELDDNIAEQFAIAAKKIQTDRFIAELIGSHGQTVYHRSPQYKSDGSLKKLGYSIQLGKGSTIAHLTDIRTVSNFRSEDIALGGQGAPLVPKIDAYLFAEPDRSVVVQNIGGMGNLTYIPPYNNPDWENKILGWDTGPGNVLIDLAISKITQGKQNYDFNGEFARKGKPCNELVNKWLESPYFQEPPPKSTGRELFGTNYLAKCDREAKDKNLTPEDYLATITELTVASIVHSYRTFLPQIPEKILLCGGGSHNQYMRQRLQSELTSAQVMTTNEVGVDGDFKEAIAFAVLAYWRFCNIEGNLPQVTGAKKPSMLGTINIPAKKIT